MKYKPTKSFELTKPQKFKPLKINNHTVFLSEQNHNTVDNAAWFPVM